MVWKDTIEIGFGIKGRFVVAWYCEKKGNTPATYGADWKKNVIQDCEDDGMNTCYVEMALKEHNRLRSRHQFSKKLENKSKKLEKYDAASRWIQEKMNASDFNGKILDKGVYNDCGENIYDAGATADAAALVALKETNVATTAWYAGQQWYDYDKGTARDPGNAARVQLSNAFANVVWASTTKVGFGVRGRWVVAWYCETKATPADTTANESNIGRQCVVDVINRCLNEDALAAHNKHRMNHSTPPLKLDDLVARKL